jgi:hypothetical protein
VEDALHRSVKFCSITKQGSHWLRWICVEISIHAANGDAAFQNLYRRICRRRGLATAKVAVARKILTVIYAMLKNKSAHFGAGVPGNRYWPKLGAKRVKRVPVILLGS